MKLRYTNFFLFSILVINNLYGQKIENKDIYISSDRTEFIEVYPHMTSEFPTYIYEWREMSGHRSTIVNRNDMVEFEIIGKNNNANYEWKIFRAAREVEEFDSASKKYKVGIVGKREEKKKVSIHLLPGDPRRRVRRYSEVISSNELRLKWKCKKLSKDDDLKEKGKRRKDKWNNLISDLYVVNLYENGIPIDFMYVFVLPEAETEYVEGFDKGVEPADEAGNYRPADYPLWYGHGYNLVELTDGKEHYGVTFEQSSEENPSRKGLGMANNTIPAISELQNQPITEKEKYWSRATRNSILHSPHHTIGTETYFGISFKIPSGQNWEWIKNDKNNTTIIIDMHTAHFPNRELQENEGGNLHITYLGDDKFGINYGVAKVAKFQKHFYLPNHEDKWIDVIFRYVFKNVKKEHLYRNRDLSSEDGIFEMWVSIDKNDFKKMKFEGETFPRDIEIDGTFDSEKGVYVPDLSEDKTTVYGPNIANSNPIYLLMITQYRIGKNGPMPIDVSNTVYYDEYITTKNIESALLHFGKKINGTSNFIKD
jgi:hypothetical protein